MLELTFDKERETKNTIRFAEREGETPPVVGTIYIQKWAAKNIGSPDTIKIKIESA